MDPAAGCYSLRFAGLNIEFIPLNYGRFSGGELGLLHNDSLVIFASHLSWRCEVTRHSLPSYDYMSFGMPTGNALREYLIASAMHKSVLCLDGVPSAPNTAIEDRLFIEDANGSIDRYLTFSDLLIKSNHRQSLKVMFPILVERTDVHVIGDFRLRPELIKPAWRLITVPED